MSKVLKNLLTNIKTFGKYDTAARDAAVAEVEEHFAAKQTNANEVMNTGRVGGGKELIPQEVMGDLLDLVPSYSYLLPVLPGDHGTGLEMKEKLPVLGEADIFAGNTEWTTGTGLYTPDGKKVGTGEVVIEQGQFILQIPVSKREMAYSVTDLEAAIRQKISLSAARTVDAVIINGDSATSSNVNLDAGTPASDAYYLQQATGLRKYGLGNSVSIGTFDDADILAMLDALGDYASDPSMLLLIVNRKVYNKMLGFTNVKTYDKVSTNATIIKGVLANIYGVDILVHRDMPALAQADGKVGDGTSGHTNTVGTCVMIHKLAVQYGFGKVNDFEITSVPGKGVVLTSTFEFGFGIPDQEAGITSKMVSTGINITLS